MGETFLNVEDSHSEKQISPEKENDENLVKKIENLQFEESQSEKQISPEKESSSEKSFYKIKNLSQIKNDLTHFENSVNTISKMHLENFESEKKFEKEREKNETNEIEFHEITYTFQNEQEIEMKSKSLSKMQKNSKNNSKTQ